MESVLYLFGLFVVSVYLLMGFDDFIWDIVTLFRRWHLPKTGLDLTKLDDLPAKRIGIMIAAWQEDEVLEAVINHLCNTMHYPKERYDIFLGVYPNDAKTLLVAKILEERHSNVHVIVNEQAGPTSKAQNINFIIRQIKCREENMGIVYDALTVHDAEDVVHPLELKVTNKLLEEHSALQFPVFPWTPEEKRKQFFRTLTASMYADEFAENHYITLVSRRQSAAFVPSAGTGFVLSRQVLSLFGQEDVFPSNSLTEDFRLALTLYQKGIHIHYALEHVWRVNEDHKIEKEFIAIRSMFPSGAKQAIRQRTRWILGITMQSFRLKDVFAFRGIRFSGRYSLYKDLKAKVGNLLPLLGYPVLLYFFVSLFVPLIPIFPSATLSWYFSICLTILMLQRQVLRAVAIYHVYGIKQAMFASFFPPLLPIRLVWGNIINLLATLRAYRQRYFGVSKAKKKGKRKISWDKTEHEFLTEAELQGFYRRTGDVLLEKGYLSPRVLQEHVKAFSMQDKKESLLEYLQEKGLVDAKQIEEVRARMHLTR